MNTLRRIVKIYSRVYTDLKNETLTLRNIRMNSIKVSKLELSTDSRKRIPGRRVSMALMSFN